jgi:peptide/nickel transport system substrate-binding protein
MDFRSYHASRRRFLAGGSAAALLTALGTGPLAHKAAAQARRNALVVGLDISDTITLDLARMAAYSPPFTLKTAYDSLVTMAPADYVTIRPRLATSWEYRPDGRAVRFKLRQGVRFASGNPMTAEDVKFSIERIINVRDQPQQYIGHVSGVDIVDPQTVDVVMSDPSQPLLTILAAPAFSVTDRQLVMANGGTSAANARESDRATQWLNTNSAGSGPYRMTGWERNQQIQLVRNTNYWEGTPAFERIIVRHMSESATQLQALRRGDVDIAFNLIPEQVQTLAGDPNVDVIREASLDYIYLAVSENAQMNPALAKKENRHAIGFAIDYDGIINSLIGGAATRPASFLPVGTNGSTEQTTREIGFKQDLARARQLLQQAGNPDGFAFELAFVNAAIAGVSYQLLAQKLQADLARVGIRANLVPMDPVNQRTQYTQGRLQAVVTFWNPPAVENQLWAEATVNRVARRVSWTVPEDLKQLVVRASAERDTARGATMWRTYQERMVDAAHLFVLIQPVYQIAVRKAVQGVRATAAGWMADLSEARPAG